MARIGVRVGALAAAFAGLLAAFFLVARPWYLSWSADRSLPEAWLPGDTLLWQGAPRETRAIVIHAPAERGRPGDDGPLHGRILRSARTTPSSGAPISNPSRAQSRCMRTFDSRTSA